MNKRLHHFTRYVLVFFALVTAYAVANEDRTKEDLAQLQSTLKHSQAEYKAQQQKIAQLEQNLKKHELSIAENAKALNMAEQSLAHTQQQQTKQQQRAFELNNTHVQYQHILAAQIKSAYMAGSNDYLKMLLNQQNTAQFERTLSYYNYLNKARITQLEELKALQTQIANNQAELAKTKANLVALYQEQKSRQDALLNAQSERQANLKNLQQQLNSTKDAIAYLKENEQTLLVTLETLEQEKTKKIELLGLSNSKGKLNWPTKGALKHTFGQRKHGGIDWKGVLISANEGANVNSIYNGQVVFADWLKGYGWVIVIDHGDGFMSLYGHAQTLLKDVGDMVSQGESVALVGQSGGQANSGLYFEIRHKGRAVNPVKWCRRI